MKGLSLAWASWPDNLGPFSAKGRNANMDQTAIVSYIRETFPGVEIVVAAKENGAPEISWGDTFFLRSAKEYYGRSRFPFATIVTKDYGEFDNASNLNRPGVFRLNIGTGKATFQTMFNMLTSHDFTALDRLMPHPVYGSMFWTCILNPSETTFQKVKPLLDEAYNIAVRSYSKKVG